MLFANELAKYSAPSSLISFIPRLKYVRDYINEDRRQSPKKSILLHSVSINQPCVLLLLFSNDLNTNWSQRVSSKTNELFLAWHSFISSAYTVWFFNPSAKSFASPLQIPHWCKLSTVSVLNKRQSVFNRRQQH